MNINVKTIFARYSNIKLGKAMDDEGQSLSDVETVLNSLGVALRTDKQHFDDFDNVIQKVASGWSKYNDIQKSEIATALAGTRQRESFLILMEKFGRVQELNTAQLNSSGNSLQKYSVYLESTEAKANKLKNSFQVLSMSMFNSDMINSAIGGLNNFVNILNATANSSTSTKLAIAGLTIAIIALSIAIKKVGLESVNTALLSFIPNLVKATVSGKLLATATNGIVSAFTFLLTPVGLLTVGIGLVTYAIIKHINHQKELKQQADDTATSYKALTEAMNQNNVAGIESEKSNLSKTEKNIQDLMNKRDELQKTLNNPNKDLSNKSSNFARSTAESDLIKTNKALEEQKQILKDAGLAFDESTGKILALAQAENQLKNNKIAKSIEDERDAIINHKNEIIGLINEYQQLDSVENKSAEQKERMSQLSNQLSGDINNLILVKDAEGNVSIRNTDLLGKNIGMLNSEIDVARTNANVKMSNAKNSAQAQVGETQVTYSEITKRIAMYQAEISAKQSALAQLDRLEKGTLTTAQQYQQYNSFRGIENLTADLSELNKAKALIDAIYGGGGGAGANFGSGGSGGGGSTYTPSNSGSGGSTSDEAKKKQDEALSNVKDVESQITDVIKKEVEKRKKAIEDEFNKRKDALQKEKDLYNKQNSEDDYNKNLKKEQGTLNQLNANIVNAQRDKSLAGQERLRDLTEQAKEQQDKIDEMILNHTRDKNNELFDLELDKLDKQKEAELTTLDNQYSDENISKMVNSALLTGKLKNISGGFVDVLTAYKSFSNEFEGGLTASGKLIQEEFIDKWTQVQNLIKGTSGVSIGINFNQLPLPSYDVGSTFISNDQVAKIHAGESILPASMNLFRGGQYLQNFMSKFNLPNLSSRSSTPVINFNQPLLNVTGGISSELDFNKMANTLTDKVTRKIMQAFEDDAIYSH